MLQGRSSNYNGLDKLPHFCAFSSKTAAQDRKAAPCPCTFQKYCEVVKEKTNKTPWKICVDQVSGQWFFIQSVPEVLSFVKSIYKASRGPSTDWLCSLPCLSSNWWASVSPIWPPGTSWMWHPVSWAPLGDQSYRSSVPRAPPWWWPWHMLSQTVLLAMMVVLWPCDCEVRLGMRTSMGHTFKLYNLYCCHCANSTHGSGELHFDMTAVDADLWPL